MQIGPEMEDLAFTPLVEMVVTITPLRIPITITAMAVVMEIIAVMIMVQPTAMESIINS